MSTTDSSASNNGRGSDAWARSSGPISGSTVAAPPTAA